MIKPVSGARTQKFGVKNSAYRLGYHPGTDYAASVGTVAKAAGGGVARYYPGNNGGYGNVGTITLSNGDVLWYAHLSGSLVKSGTRVSEGQNVFRTGNTGWVTGPHLHIEYRVKGNQNHPVDFETKLKPKKTVAQLAQEVLKGLWGNGSDRKTRLTAAGYNYNAVQAEVNKLVSKPAPAKAVTYVVRKGDTLGSIAKRFGTTLKVLLQKNSQYKKNPNLIYPGQKVKIK